MEFPICQSIDSFSLFCLARARSPQLNRSRPFISSWTRSRTSSRSRDSSTASTKSSRPLRGPSVYPRRRQPLDGLQLGEQRLQRRQRLPVPERQLPGRRRRAGRRFGPVHRKRRDPQRRHHSHRPHQRLRRRPTRTAAGTSRKAEPDYLKTRFRQEHARKGSAFTLTPDPASAPIVYQDEFVNWVKTKYPVRRDRPGTPDLFLLWTTSRTCGPPRTRRSTRRPSRTRRSWRKRSSTPARSRRWRRDARSSARSATGGRGTSEPAERPRCQQPRLPGVLPAARWLRRRKTCGKRLLDVLDVHWYPEAQGGGERVSTQDNKPAVVAARLQAPRSLWDPSYTETAGSRSRSTKGPITLLPRLRGQDRPQLSRHRAVDERIQLRRRQGHLRRDRRGRRAGDLRPRGRLRRQRVADGRRRAIHRRGPSHVPRLRRKGARTSATSLFSRAPTAWPIPRFMQASIQQTPAGSCWSPSTRPTMQSRRRFNSPIASISHGPRSTNSPRLLRNRKVLVLFRSLVRRGLTTRFRR